MKNKNLKIRKTRLMKTMMLTTIVGITFLFNTSSIFSEIAQAEMTQKGPNHGNQEPTWDPPHGILTYDSTKYITVLGTSNVLADAGGTDIYGGSHNWNLDYITLNIEQQLNQDDNHVVPPAGTALTSADYIHHWTVNPDITMGESHSSSNSIEGVSVTATKSRIAVSFSTLNMGGLSTNIWLEGCHLGAFGYHNAIDPGYNDYDIVVPFSVSEDGHLRVDVSSLRVSDGGTIAGTTDSYDVSGGASGDFSWQIYDSGNEPILYMGDSYHVNVIINKQNPMDQSIDTWTGNNLLPITPGNYFFKATCLAKSFMGLTQWNPGTASVGVYSAVIQCDVNLCFLSNYHYSVPQIDP